MWQYYCSKGIASTFTWLQEVSGLLKSKIKIEKLIFGRWWSWRGRLWCNLLFANKRENSSDRTGKWPNQNDNSICWQTICWQIKGDKSQRTTVYYVSRISRKGHHENWMKRTKPNWMDDRVWPPHNKLRYRTTVAQRKRLCIIIINNKLRNHDFIEITASFRQIHCVANVENESAEDLYRSHRIRCWPERK